MPPSPLVNMPHQLALRTLEITDCMIGDEQLTSLSWAIPSLQKLAIGTSYSLANFDRLKRSVTSTRGLFSLLHHCSHLRNIHLTASANIHFRYTSFLSQSLFKTNLISMHRDVAFFFKDKHFPKLEQFSFHINKGDNTVDTDCLALLFAACPCLRVIRLPEYCCILFASLPFSFPLLFFTLLFSYSLFPLSLFFFHFISFIVCRFCRFPGTPCSTRALQGVFANSIISK